MRCGSSGLVELGFVKPVLGAPLRFRPGQDSPLPRLHAALRVFRIAPRALRAFGRAAPRPPAP
eukprot:13140176-Alexandrium_andersonii.AAC.1